LVWRLQAFPPKIWAFHTISKNISIGFSKATSSHHHRSVIENMLALDMPPAGSVWMGYARFHGKIIC